MFSTTTLSFHEYASGTVIISDYVYTNTSTHTHTMLLVKTFSPKYETSDTGMSGGLHYYLHLVVPRDKGQRSRISK